MTLISPIKIDGQFYCANEGYAAALDGPWRTESVLFGEATLNTTELDNAWYITPLRIGENFTQSGGVKFGLACGVSEVVVRITHDVDTTDTPAEMSISLNGVGIWSLSKGPSPIASVDISVSITDPHRPCGNIIAISGTMTSNTLPTSDDGVQIRAEITSVS